MLIGNFNRKEHFKKIAVCSVLWEMVSLSLIEGEMGKGSFLPSEVRVLRWKCVEEVGRRTRNMPKRTTGKM